MTRAKGFAPLYLLILVVVIAAVGLVGWRVYQNRQTADISSNASADTALASPLEETENSLNNEAVDTSLNSDQLDSDIENLL